MESYAKEQKTVIPEFHETAQHGTPGFPMKVYRNDFTNYVAGQIPWHFHEELEFCVVTKGVVHFYLQGEEITLQAGEGIFINSNTLHHMIPEDMRKAYMFSVVVHAGLLGADKGFVLATSYVRPYISDKQKPFHVMKGNTDSEREVLFLLKQIFEVWEGKDYAREYKLHNRICEVWLELLHIVWNNEPVEQSVTDVDGERLHRALSYISMHYNEEIGLTDICKAASISRSECCRCFKRNLQMSPISYLIMYRVNAAAAQLETGSKSITDIAQDTGFTDDSYFCKIFKRYMSMTPLEYRRQKGTIGKEGTEHGTS